MFNWRNRFAHFVDFHLRRSARECRKLSHSLECPTNQQGPDTSGCSSDCNHHWNFFWIYSGIKYESGGDDDHHHRCREAAEYKRVLVSATRCDQRWKPNRKSNNWSQRECKRWIARDTFDCECAECKRDDSPSCCAAWMHNGSVRRIFCGALNGHEWKWKIESAAWSSEQSSGRRKSDEAIRADSDRSTETNRCVRCDQS